ncbi:MAG TPA: fumarylacetoacetate hydrolase family protein [Aquabacterium sp.]|uniref:fumarylacetoacetate hydrolase family protein n=1 Tax=Aquabacterium sp. TaxID=1872578 RepID=UPI002E333FE2|nr:fumarylacetoacetate hydrolase family protein [Aquabacterium sp.]HEX5357499.1 fumarylacetoacetate hydrolase family protein [Aquabacterium sp.]
MHLCSYEVDGQVQVGLVHGSGIVNLSKALAGELSAHQPMIDLITRWSALKNRVAALLEAPADVTVDQVHLLAPVPRPGKTLAIGLNYVEHVNENIIGESRTVPDHQIWFPKLANAINGPFDPIVLPRISQMTDYEAEMVTIIGQRCRHVPRERASEVVFGYCVGNDVSVRDIQKRTSQWTLGKSFDTHAPFGPWITTADEVGDPHGLEIQCLVNGEVRQHSNTRLMIHKVWDQIAQLSQVMTLEPGDVIFTGTCSGVGAAFNPPKFLKAGDTVRVEIESLGAIVARCVDEDDDSGEA